MCCDRREGDIIGQGQTCRWRPQNLLRRSLHRDEQTSNFVFRPKIYSNEWGSYVSDGEVKMGNPDRTRKAALWRLSPPHRKPSLTSCKKFNWTLTNRSEPGVSEKCVSYDLKQSAAQTTVRIGAWRGSQWWHLTNYLPSRTSPQQLWAGATVAFSANSFLKKLETNFNSRLPETKQWSVKCYCGVVLAEADTGAKTYIRDVS